MPGLSQVLAAFLITLRFALRIRRESLSANLRASRSLGRAGVREDQLHLVGAVAVAGILPASG